MNADGMNYPIKKIKVVQRQQESTKQNKLTSESIGSCPNGLYEDGTQHSN